MKLVASSDLIEFMRDSPEISQKAWEAFLPWHVNQPDASQPLRERVAELEEAIKDILDKEEKTRTCSLSRKMNACQKFGESLDKAEALLKEPGNE